MAKILIGPRLRQLRRQHGQTQADMARALGVSPSYVNLLENNQRSLSVQMLMALSEAYSVDWRDLTRDESSRLIAELRQVTQDPIFGGEKPDLQELRGAIDHAPKLVESFLALYNAHRTALENVLRYGGETSADEFTKASPETHIHDFFRDHSNHFPELEEAAEAARREVGIGDDNHYPALKAYLQTRHGIGVALRRIDEMSDALREYDEAGSTIKLSQALDHANRVFQLAHMLCVVELPQLLGTLADRSGIVSATALARLRVELANYFAAAFLMPYGGTLAEAQATGYDIDRIAAAFSVSFEQVCQRLTTLQRDGARGVPFFFLRIDRAGNVTKRFNSTSFQLAEYGGACPVWNIHRAFHQPGVILPQFVEMPDGERYFTISRTAHRPVFGEATQDRRLTLALGCSVEHAPRLRYASSFRLDDPEIFAPIGLNCHLCPRQACSQRAHQPLFVELPMNTNRRGSTRYES